MDTVPGKVSPAEFRLFLQDELVRRCKKNPRFSLRAFARTLAIEPSALSKILHGKRALTPKMLQRIATQLGMSDAEIKRYEPSTRLLPRRPTLQSGLGDKISGATSQNSGEAFKSVTVSLAKHLLPEAEILIEKLQQELNDLSDRNPNGERSIFQLEVTVATTN